MYWFNSLVGGLRKVRNIEIGTYTVTISSIADQFIEPSLTPICGGML